MCISEAKQQNKKEIHNVRMVVGIGVLEMAPWFKLAPWAEKGFIVNV